MQPMSGRGSEPRIAFVLGGGGHMGAHEVGMLHALLERKIEPHLVVGTSVGAINGAAVAAAPTLDTVERLREVWLGLDDDTLFGGSIFSGAAKLWRRRTHLHTNESLRTLLSGMLPARFEDLTVEFQCVAACIERAAEHWFASGPLVDAILASAALPGGEHFMDGGIVNSIPIARAVELGAREIYVLHVGRIERPLQAPRNPLQVGIVAFEIARRHRFARDLATLPSGVVAHVLPTGQPEGPYGADLSQLNYRQFKAVSDRIERAYRATAEHLDRTEAQR
jgi:NTE family protein